jgi:hypothetical protein
MDIGIFMEQAHSLYSFICTHHFYEYKLGLTEENIHSILPRYAKHLHIPINDLNQINKILERCENLLTINFDIEDIISPNKVIKWFDDNTINTTCQQNYKMVSVWLGQRKIQSTQTTFRRKRIKLIDNN